jgi:O-antigen/teichoic acid export membrane protein
LSSFQRFISNISWNVLGKVCVQVLLFGISVLLARYLGKERLGIYATLLVVPTFVRLLNQFGLEILINKKVPELNVLDPSGRQARYLIQRLLTIRGASSILFCAFLYVCLPYYMDFMGTPHLIEYRPVLIIYFLVISLNSLLSTLFMTRLQYKIVSATETGCAFLNLVFLAGFIVLDYGIYGVLYAYILSTGFNILIYFGLTWNDLKGETQAPDFQEMYSLARATYLIAILSLGLITQADVVLMNYFQVGSVGIGFYHLATGLGGMLAFILVGVGPLALSIFSESYARGSAKDLSRIWCQIVGFASFLTIPVFVFVLFNADSFISFVYGEEFKKAGDLLSLYIIFVGCSTVLGLDFVTSTLFVLKRQGTVVRVTVEGSLLNIGLNLILIPLYQETGAVAGTGIAMVYMVFRQLLVIQKQMNILPVWPTIGKCLLISLVAVIPTQVFASLFLNHVLLSVFIYVFSFFIVLAGLKPFTMAQTEVLQNIHSKFPIWISWFVRN